MAPTTSTTVVSTVAAEAYSHGFTYITVLTAMVGSTAAGLNALCLAALFKKRLHQDDNRFIFMALLAAADMLMGITFTIDILIRHTNMIPDSSVRNDLCIFNAIFLELSVPGELFALTLLTLDTFLKIELHMRYVSIVTKSVVSTAILVVVVLTLLQLIPFFLITDKNDWQCVEHGSYPEWYNNYVTAVYFVFPFVLILTMHGRIFCIVRSTSRKVGPSTVGTLSGAAATSGNHQATSSEEGNSINDENSILPAGNQHKPKPKPRDTSQDRKAFLTATVLIGLMLLSWVPTYAILIALSVNPDLFDTEAMAHIIPLSVIFLISNAMVNPIVYIIRVPQVRGTIKNLCKQ